MNWNFSNKIHIGMLVILLLALACVYFYLMNPNVAGFLYDDGMYLMTAQALAHGQSYQLGGIVGQPLFYKYPPLYPLLLAGMWLMQPHFPENIIWLKSLNIALSIATLSLLFYHFRRQQQFSWWISLGLVALIGTNWRWIEVSIEMMSEPLFLLLSMATFVMTYQLLHKRQSSPSLWDLVLLILLSVASFYARTMGLVLIVALTIALCLKTARAKAGAYAVGCGILMAPWFVWSATKPDTTRTIGDFLVRSFQETYFQVFRMDLAYEYTLPELYGKGVQELLGHVSIQFFPILERLIWGKTSAGSEFLILGISFTLVLFLGYWAYQAIKAKQYSVLGIYISVYLLILPFWSFHKFYPRFLIAILPLLFVAFIQGFYRSRLSDKARQVWITGFLVIGIATNLMHWGARLQKPYPNTLLSDSKQDLWTDYSEIFRFLREKTPKDAVIYSDNGDESYFYALNTQRAALDFFLFLPERKIDQACPKATKQCLLGLYQQNAQITYELLKQHSASYILVNRIQVIKSPYNSGRLVQKNPVISDMMLARYPKALIPVARTADGWITLYRFQPE